MREALLAIEKLTFGGAGLGRLDGQACFVPFTAPGDEARIRITKAKRSYLEGEVLELLQPSTLRAPPPCPVFGSCGGCNWQHLEYPAQIAAKGDIFADLLWRGGKVERGVILPALAAPNPYGYRSRVQLKLRLAAGTLHMGFYRGGTHYVVAIPGKCAIADPVINRLITELRLLLREFPSADRLPQIDIAVGDDGLAILIFHFIGDHPAELHDFLVQRLSMLPSAAGIFLQSGRKSTLTRVAGIEKLSYRVPSGFLPDLPETVLSFSRGGFSQVNYRQNLALLSTVAAWLAPSGTERLLDIYCGNGNFSLPLARYVSSVVGIEEYEPSIDDARWNALANGIDNALFRCQAAMAGIQALVAAGESFDLVLLDPPRSGAADIIAHLHALSPRAIAYVSCDPATLARDIGLLRAHGYTVTKSRPIDMFPQTYHIESVTLFEPCTK
ncbi:23S rRNA (uracil(1939)-C(5))-methyltransferase RlmD [Geobacter sp. AOG1]|uniref:23S rRNA (uracil(1939)-C(5))-methyltransferase RlmD n=1 Tax=Geobacter sp. AOG1 TaxID=1566346 RepID=UPI001CC5955F|nr:23S rRNA (uracil(1939)-C(5))-methyltransferase RlmD [Geobacter sp. AOG1]GFE58561.1 putative RNA methyltransferase [Geobacter sp. AOG1]